MLGIAKTLETITDLKQATLVGIDLGKQGYALIKDGSVTWGKLGEVLDLVKKLNELAKEVKELVVDAPAALPELKDLDPTEVGQVATAAYAAVKEVVEKIAA